ncbi:FLYWCH-type domain-containing protein [Aphis craccivora]|uniref:FLYWCH-type domain-containing protein n=1 Tax=Aphis craccivora TaxID=307492 RepID=A0A6G0Y5T3_APHCR|nr:FLYWCH-type domain-containing protein [Aphis craccivora]
MINEGNIFLYLLPTSLDNALQQLRILETDKYFMFKNQKFIYAPADANFICLTTVQNINFLVKFCSELFCDGTFDYSPKKKLKYIFLVGNIKIDIFDDLKTRRITKIVLPVTCIEIIQEYSNISNSYIRMRITFSKNQKVFQSSLNIEISLTIHFKIFNFD